MYTPTWVSLTPLVSNAGYQRGNFSKTERKGVMSLLLYKWFTLLEHPFRQLFLNPATISREKLILKLAEKLYRGSGGFRGANGGNCPLHDEN